MGGTYNPPHTGHLHAAVAARNALRLDRVILLPSFLPPHKQMPRHTPDAEARLVMTSLAAAEIGAEVSDLEIRRGGTSYTADTLAEFARQYPQDTLWFIMGTDMFLTVQNWVRPHEIFSLARIAVVLRDDSDAERVKMHKTELEKTFSCKIDLVDAKAHPISSTELRENVLDEEHQMYLPKSVLDYIKQHRFYLSEEKKDRA
ncbi:MAG: nicotinate-nucleotide adenylyltransferase [Oscillospiraceae bacterium]|nr:nicotinate-nucleotide adenylyltransferase [Oscillospiraceae bacterium]